MPNLPARYEQTASLVPTEFTYPVLPEIAGDREHLRELVGDAYKQLELDDMLRRYAFGYQVSDEDPTPVGDAHVLGALHMYNGMVSLVSMQRKTPDVDMVRDGFDLVYDGMDAAIEAKMFPPQSAMQQLLVRAGVGRQRSARHMARLNEQFWTVQFPEMLAGKARAQRQSEDNDAIYMWRVLDECMRGHVFSKFSYVQQATHIAGITIRR